LYSILEVENSAEEGLVEYRAILHVAPLYLKQNTRRHIENQGLRDSVLDNPTVATLVTKVLLKHIVF
jgi:hypothetical protein